MYIKVDKTPNENVLKFTVGTELWFEGEFRKGGEYGDNELMSSIFRVVGVEEVFVCDNFISVTKGADVTWGEIKPSVLSTIVDVIDQKEVGVKRDVSVGNNAYVPKNDREKEIQRIIDQRVRSAVQSDGGDAEFLGVNEDGFVRIRLKGACVGCASSDITLKNGIEKLLKHYFPDVSGIEKIEDE